MKLSRLHVPWELLVFAAASVMAGAGYSLFDSIFNNFLNATFALTGFQRSFLEFPRELPGFLVVFVTALLGFLCSRRLGAVAMLLGALGALLIGLASPGYAVMVVWLFIYSLGQHLFMPIAATIGMELAPEGQAGRRLGQLNGLRNLAAILELATELERIGDYGKGIARITVMMGDEPLIKPLIDIPRMAEKACDMLHRALDAFIRRDVDMARAIPKEDDEVDALYNTVFNDLMKLIVADPRVLDQATRLLWVAHNLERAADRVTNICERVIFTATGQMMEMDMQEPKEAGTN